MGGHEAKKAILGDPRTGKSRRSDPNLGGERPGVPYRVYPVTSDRETDAQRGAGGCSVSQKPWRQQQGGLGRPHSEREPQRTLLPLKLGTGTQHLPSPPLTCQDKVLVDQPPGDSGWRPRNMGPPRRPLPPMGQSELQVTAICSPGLNGFHPSQEGTWVGAGARLGLGSIQGSGFVGKA